MQNILETFSISTESVGRAMADINDLSDAVVNEALAALGFMPEEDAEAAVMLKHVAAGVIKNEEDLESYVEAKMNTYRSDGPVSKISTRPRAGLLAFSEPPVPSAEPVLLSFGQPTAEPVADAEPEVAVSFTDEQPAAEPEPKTSKAPKATRKRTGETAYDRAAAALTALVEASGEDADLKVADALEAIKTADSSIPEQSARVYVSVFNKANGNPFGRQNGRGRKPLAETGYDKAAGIISALVAKNPQIPRKDVIAAVEEGAFIKRSSAAVYASRYFKENPVTVTVADTAQAEESSEA